MRTILYINGLEPFKSSDGKKHIRTHATVDDGTECSGYGTDFIVGDLVEVFLNGGFINMRKPVDKPLTSTHVNGTL